MKKSTNLKLIAILVLVSAGRAASQDPVLSPAPSSGGASDVEMLREQVKALSETVKALQKQVQDQNAVLEKANIVAGPGASAKSGAVSDAGVGGNEGKCNSRRRL